MSEDEVGCGNCKPVATIELVDGTWLTVFVCGHGGVRVLERTPDGALNEYGHETFQFRVSFANGQAVIEAGSMAAGEAMEDVPIAHTFLNGEHIGAVEAADVRRSEDRIESIDEALRRWM